MAFFQLDEAQTKVDAIPGSLCLTLPVSSPI